MFEWEYVMSFGWTDHARDRSRQRHIPEDVAMLAMMEGRQLDNISDRFLLTEEMFDEIRRSGLYKEDLLKKASKVCPIVVVVNSGTVVTAFRPTERIDRGYRGIRRGKRNKD
jgi:hypothetical protein